MKEIFAVPAEPPPDPGRVFYTVREDDLRKPVVRTVTGVINLLDVLGRVLPGDVGCRLYRVPRDDGTGWFWQAESASQRDRRRSAQLTDACPDEGAVYIPAAYFACCGHCAHSLRTEAGYVPGLGHDEGCPEGCNDGDAGIIAERPAP